MVKVKTLWKHREDSNSFKDAGNKKSRSETGEFPGYGKHTDSLSSLLGSQVLTSPLKILNNVSLHFSLVSQVPGDSEACPRCVESQLTCNPTSVPSPLPSMQSRALSPSSLCHGPHPASPQHHSPDQVTGDRKAEPHSSATLPAQRFGRWLVHDLAPRAPLFQRLQCRRWSSSLWAGAALSHQ